MAATRLRVAAACMAALLCVLPVCAQAPLQLTVEQAIARALQQNRGIKIQKQDVAHFAALKDRQHADYLPKLDNRSKATYLTDLEGIVIPAGALGIPAATGPIPARTLRIDQGGKASYASGTHLSQPTTELFTVHALNRAAQADLNRARLEVDDSEEGLAIEVRQLFYGMQIIAKQQQAADAAEQAVRETLRESVASQQGGASLSVNDIEYQASLLERQQQQLKLRIALHRDSLELADLIGAPLDTPFTLLDSPELTPAPLPTRSEARALALRQQPKVRSAEQAVEKAHAELAAAEDQYIPHVDAVASYEYQSGVPFLTHNFGVFGVQFTYDLFDGGAREAKIRDARAGLEKAEIALEQTREDATIAVEEAYDQVDQADQSVALAEGALRARTEAARLAQADFENGASLASKRDQARAEQLSSEASALEARLGLTLAQNQVRRVLGQIAN